MVGKAGFEPATTGFQNRYADQTALLSYERVAGTVAIRFSSSPAGGLVSLSAHGVMVRSEGYDPPSLGSEPSILPVRRQANEWTLNSEHTLNPAPCQVKYLLRTRKDSGLPDPSTGYPLQG